MYVKFTCAKQAKAIHEYKTIKTQLYKTIVAIWYNKTCRDKHLSPKYVSIKISGRNWQSTNTLRAAIHYRINQEIKFLYIKKNKLTFKGRMLYISDAACTPQWPNILYI